MEDEKKVPGYYFCLVLGIIFAPMIVLLIYLCTKNQDKIVRQKKTRLCVAVYLFSFIFFGGILLLTHSPGGGGNTETDNGYRTSCYTRPDGKRCCTSCKKTSYGDVGCATTCN